MFDFPILITLIIPILIFYFTFYINLKKEIEDISNSSENSNVKKLKIHNRKNKIKLLNIITALLIIVILLLYFYPYLKSFISDLQLNDYTKKDSINFYDILDSLKKLFPFKNGFFSEHNFTFSYITGIILSVIFEIVLFYFLYEEIVVPIKSSDYLGIIIALIIWAYLLIWANNYISAFLSFCIINYFEFLSIVLNILAYILIGFIAIIISFIFYILLDS